MDKPTILKIAGVYGTVMYVEAALLVLFSSSKKYLVLRNGVLGKKHKGYNIGGHSNNTCHFFDPPPHMICDIFKSFLSFGI